MRKRLVRLGVILAAVLAGAVGGLLLWPTPRPAVTLANGIQLDCLGATYGTNHVQPGGSRLARLLPRQLKAWLGLSQPAQTVNTAAPSLAIWLREDPSSLSNRLGRIGGGTIIGGLLTDEGGIVGGNLAPHFFWGGGSRGVNPFALVFRSVPYRSREITVRLVDIRDRTGKELLGELTLSNPAHRRAPTWEAETLPACRTNGALTCRLEQVAVGLGNHVGRIILGEFPAAKLNEAPRALAVFRFEEGGLPAEDWTVGKVLLTDATGNLLAFEDGQPGTDRTVDELVFASAQGNLATTESRARQHGDGLVVQHFDRALWPGEVWGLTVWAEPTSPAVVSERDSQERRFDFRVRPEVVGTNGFRLRLDL